MTEDADPTMTSPMTQSSPTSTSSSVDTESWRPPMRMPTPADARPSRCAAERASLAVVASPGPSRPGRVRRAPVRCWRRRHGAPPGDAGAPLCTVRHPMHAASLPHRHGGPSRWSRWEGHVNFATVRKSP